MTWQSSEQQPVGVSPVDLQRFDEDYRKASSGSAADAPALVSFPRFTLPDGQYQVMVETVELTTTKSTGRPMLKWRFRITSGQFENRWIFKNRVITENTLDWVKKELTVCGMELEPFSSLPFRLQDMVNVELAVAKVTRGEHENIYINKRLTPEANGELAELSDELPF